MTLVDTSVWIDHLKKGNARLASLLADNEVLAHPFVVGELACGTLQARATIFEYLEDLPAAVIADHREALSLLEGERLYKRGIGWIDVHLLASARLSGARLWTLDAALSKVAASLDLC
jgi:predicted nucleic acid-binding protein